MAKFKVKVRIIAECEYTVEVEREDECDAEEAAISLWREKLPSDFQVEKGYITDWETEAEQLTVICPDCSIEHVASPPGHPAEDAWSEDPDYCKPCGAKIEAEEAKHG